MTSGRCLQVVRVLSHLAPGKQKFDTKWRVLSNFKFELWTGFVELIFFIGVTVCFCEENGWKIDYVFVKNNYLSVGASID